MTGKQKYVEIVRMTRVHLALRQYWWVVGVSAFVVALAIGVELPIPALWM